MNDLSNAIVCVAPMRLDIKLARIHARVGHSAIIRIVRVPADVQGLFIRIFTAAGSYFDVPANEHRTPGIWTARVIGTCFPQAGELKYEVHATDPGGDPTALGEGVVAITPFSTTASPIEAGVPVTVAQVPSADGSMVQVRMVLDEEGQWVFQAVTESAGGQSSGGGTGGGTTGGGGTGGGTTGSDGTGGGTTGGDGNVDDL